MATTPVPPVVRSPQLVRGVTDASQNRSKQFVSSAYAVGKIFTGVTLRDNIDLDTYVTPGVSRLNTYRNGPPVTSPAYLVIHAVNPDEDKSGIGLRYRQIYYPDSTTETTPYTRVGRGTSTSNISWSTWTTMGGNWVCEVLTSNKAAVVNYMYHSFGSWTLTLPDPTQYVQGTRIGLTQWLNQGKVVYGSTEQVTTPDLNKAGQVIGALQYIFQIVPNSAGVNQWSLDVDQDLSDWLNEMRAGLQANIDNLYKLHVQDMERLGNLSGNTSTTLQNAINKEIQDRINADILLKTELIDMINTNGTTSNNDITAEINARIAGDNKLDRDKRRDRKTITNVTNATFTYDTAADATLTNNLGKYDYRLMVSGSGTVTLPTNVTIQGASVILMIQPNKTCNVVAGSISESFTNNDANSVLVVDLETVATSPTDSYTWTVLEIG